MSPSPTHRLGIDENGLGARLGPLVVTAVLARVTEEGTRLLGRRPGKRLRGDLDDSKRLVSHGNVILGEAWARSLVPGASTPAELFERLSHDGRSALRALCPSHVESQCWSVDGDEFAAPPELVERLRGHLAFWARRGVVVEGVRTAIRCSERLNRDRGTGKNRFVTDLHAMEDLILAARANAGSNVLAVCGKVGGMHDYSRFFGPLSGQLHAELVRGKALSAYHFPQVGEVRFLRDADGKDALVMLASLVGKYVRELFMARVNRFYQASLGPEPLFVSGYHDPSTTRFVRATELIRKANHIPDGCFERVRDDP